MDGFPTVWFPCGIASAIAVVSHGQSEIMIGIGVAAVEIGKCSEVILSGVCRPRLCLQLLPGDRIIFFTNSWLAPAMHTAAAGQPRSLP